MKIHKQFGCFVLHNSSLCKCVPANGQLFSKPQVRHHQQYNTKPSEEQCDKIGPPHPVSNLRPVHFHIPKCEAAIEKRYRLKREEVQNWNQNFWFEHNAKFIKERKDFVAANQLANSEAPLSADKMSTFYKSFLDKNWKTHLDYNFQWYKKNAQLVLLHLRVKVFWLWQHWRLK